MSMKLREWSVEMSDSETRVRAERMDVAPTAIVFFVGSQIVRAFSNGLWLHVELLTDPGEPAVTREPYKLPPAVPTT